VDDGGKVASVSFYRAVDDGGKVASVSWALLWIVRTAGLSVRSA
jgi:hypothetical protein